MTVNDNARSEAIMRAQAAASLAAGIITSSGRKYSMDEAKAVFDDCYFTLFPSVGNGRYEHWKQSFDSSKKYE